MRWGSAASLGLVSLWLLAAAAPADAATAEIGAVGFVNNGLTPDGNSPFVVGVQDTEVVPGPFGIRPYEVPPGYGVITQWSHSAGTVGGRLGFGVMRRYDDPYTKWAGVVVDIRGIVANKVNRFDARAPVRPGDRLVLGSENPGHTPQIQFAITTTNLANNVDELIDYYGGQSVDQERSGYLLDVSARVETDADGDGYGDDTQDACPTRADLQTECPKTGLGPGGRGIDTERPTILRPRLSASVFRAAGSGPPILAGARKVPVGTRVSFTASEAGSVMFRVARRASGRRVAKQCKAPTRRNRGRKRCIRYPTVKGSFTVAAWPGANTFTFRGRIGGRKLRPGRYRLVGTAKDRAGNSASVPAKAFRIVR